MNFSLLVYCIVAQSYPVYCKKKLVNIDHPLSANNIAGNSIKLAELKLPLKCYSDMVQIQLRLKHLIEAVLELELECTKTRERERDKKSEE